MATPAWDARLPLLRRQQTDRLLDRDHRAGGILAPDRDGDLLAALGLLQRLEGRLLQLHLHRGRLAGGDRERLRAEHLPAALEPDLALAPAAGVTGAVDPQAHLALAAHAEALAHLELGRRVLGLGRRRI